MRKPPADTRACGRGQAVAPFQECHAPYVINRDSISLENGDFLAMPDPFYTYEQEAAALVGTVAVE
jgi:hypothetical protein